MSVPIFVNVTVEDKLVWSSSTNGKISIKSAYDFLGSNWELNNY